MTDFSASAGQCLKWSHYFQPYFENILECRVWVTVGQLWKQERFIYNPSVADFQRWSEKGIQPEDFRHHSGFNFHAWLTTENGVIVDVSFMSTLSRRLPEHLSEVSGSVIIGTPETVLPEYKYVPMIVGQRIVEKIENALSLVFWRTTILIYIQYLQSWFRYGKNVKARNNTMHLPLSGTQLVT